MNRLFAALVGCIACCPDAPVAPPALEAPAVMLAETVPVETSGLYASDAIDTQRAWLDLIAGAEQRLDVAGFYVSTRPEGGGKIEPVLAAMENAADRGVKVRLLVDGLFAGIYPDALDRLGKRFPVHKLDVKSRTGGVHHAKYMIADRHVVYIGSANLDWRSLEHVYELGVVIDAPALASSLGQVFEMDWEGETSVPPTSWPAVALAGEETLRLVASPQQWLPQPSAWDLPLLLKAIANARRTICVQLLDYDATFRDGTPFDELQVALEQAGARGVRVRLLLSSWQKEHMAAVQRLERAPGVEVKLMEIPEHSSGFIPFARVVHAKYMVVDGGLSWVGTSNWSGDYFYKSRNVGVIIEGRGTARRLQRIFDAGYASAYASVVDPDATYTPPRIGR